MKLYDMKTGMWENIPVDAKGAANDPIVAAGYNKPHKVDNYPTGGFDERGRCLKTWTPEERLIDDLVRELINVEEQLEELEAVLYGL